MDTSAQYNPMTYDMPKPAQFDPMSYIREPTLDKHEPCVPYREPGFTEWSGTKTTKYYPKNGYERGLFMRRSDASHQVTASSYVSLVVIGASAVVLGPLSILSYFCGWRVVTPLRLLCVPVVALVGLHVLSQPHLNEQKRLNQEIAKVEHTVTYHNRK